MPPNRRILIIFAHPALHRSRVHVQLADRAREVEGITFRDLYEHYPDFHIDVGEEQRLLTEHDLVVFQHPFYWYSTPAIIKQWEDLVLEHNWAYGTRGTALRGKQLLSVLTAGGRESAYQEGGHNRYTVRQFLAPIEQTARLCGMDYLPPYMILGTHSMDVAQITTEANLYVRTLSALRDNRFDLATAAEFPRLNWNLDAVIGG
jgi:glutathione-regulated potassium-efflux system ancillary protein KefG